ncbi:unnamed protein product [Phytophthora fragariaefolia]|uniref:Unnamed protein product n=1 Tax=Phytophthora fragariaefolia TaxID=1490495 RepID=A0A9W6XYJ8_9STRA|nr:unnamed protein product [Phytophthora fragariaefolia]
MGPLRAREAVGYDSYLLRREDKTSRPEEIVAHASFLASYKSPTTRLQQAAKDLRVELDDEDSGRMGHDVSTMGAAGSTYWSSSCAQPTLQRPEPGPASSDGSPSLNTMSSLTPEKSWKTFSMGKACGWWRSRQKPQQRTQSAASDEVKTAAEGCGQGPLAAAHRGPVKRGKILALERPRGVVGREPNEKAEADQDL